MWAAFRLIARVATVPSGYSAGWRWQTGRTRGTDSVLLIAAGQRLLGQVVAIPNAVRSHWSVTTAFVLYLVHSIYIWPKSGFGAV